MEIKREGIDYRKDASDLANGDLQATLALQWALIRHNGSKLLSDKSGTHTTPTITPTAPTITPTTTHTTTIIEAEGGSAANASEQSKQNSMRENLMRFLNSHLPPHLQIKDFTTR